MVWVGLLEESFEVICRWPRLTPVGAACLPVVAIVMVGHGRGTLGTLVVPPLVTLSTLLGTVDCYVE
jgi:hypothetical protein